MKQNKKILMLFLLIQGISYSQRTFETVARTEGLKAMDAFRTFLAIPNVGDSRADLDRNSMWCRARLEALGFKTQLLETSAVPLVLATRTINPQQPTVAFYLHIDGQAVDPSKWDQQSPWKAELKKNVNGKWQSLTWDKLQDPDIDTYRIFARSSSDDKGPFIMLTTALRILEQQKKFPAFNIKVILDFEEESSSPGLPEAVANYKKELTADALLILDGPMHASGEPTLVFGNRGISSLTLTTYGPETPQHSGHYGNYIPNPALRLSQILASMKDAQGRVVIPGFYDGIRIDAKTQNVLEAVPNEAPAIKQRTKIGSVDAVGRTYQESLQYPSLNIRGLQSGWVGKEKRTIIPATATAEIDVRLVLESQPEKLIASIQQHIEALGYTVLDQDPTDTQKMKYEKILKMVAKVHYPAFRTPVYAPAGVWLSKALEKYYEKAPVKIRTSGGSVPISPFVNQLGVPAIGLPTVNIDNNQHSPNENLQLKNYFEGIETLLTVLTTPF